MAVNTVIEFNDPLQHIYDPSKVEIVGGEAKLKSQALSSEILFANYDVDAVDLSKRGGKTIIFEGVSNTGEVKDGVLKFATEDRSIASYKNITDIVSDFAFRVRAESNILTTVQDRNIARLISNTDNSKIEFYLQNQGSGVSRVKRKITDSAGTVISDLIIATADLSVMTDYNIAFSNEGSVENRTYFNGALVSTFAGISFDFSDCDLIFGDNTSVGQTATANYDNVQLWSSDAIQSGFAFPFPEDTTYALLPQQIVTAIPLLMDKWISFSANAETLNGSLVKFHEIRNSDRYWFNAVSSLWEIVNMGLDLFSQTNTDTEINDNLGIFPLTQGVGAYIQLVSFLKSSTDGYTTPKLDFLTLSYSFYFKPLDVPVCVVYGVVYGNDGKPVSGATIEANGADFFTNNVLVGPKAKTTSNAEGRWNMTLVQTEPTSNSVDFAISYDNDGIPVVNKYRNKIIPIASTKKFVDLLDAPEV